MIGNGDIFKASDAVRMLDETGCDGLMIARGAMGNPWLFSSILSAVNGDGSYTPPPLRERLAIALSQATDTIREKGERTGMAESKKHLAAYIHDIRGAAEYRDRIMTCADFAAVEALFCEIIEAVESGCTD